MRTLIDLHQYRQGSLVPHWRLGPGSKHQVDEGKDITMPPLEAS